MLSAGPVQIGVIDRDGGRERTLTPITENSELPAWSPDGSHIAFCRGFEGHRAIWRMRADGTDAHGLTNARSDDVGPTYSPDGHFIAFSRRGSLMIMRSDGSDSRPVGVRGTLPAWTAGQGDAATQNNSSDGAAFATRAASGRLRPAFGRRPLRDDRRASQPTSAARPLTMLGS